MAAGGNPIPTNHVVVSASENFSELMSKIEMFNLLDDRPPNIIIMRDPLKHKKAATHL